MNVPKNTEQCMVCGTRLDYLQAAEDLVCTYCGTGKRGHVKCPQGHFICDACHGKEARSMVEGLALSTKAADPLEIAELMMAHPGMPMLSCDHAFVVAGALLAALGNSPYGRITDRDIREAFERTAGQAHGGYCGLTGVCGIAPAVGACFSIYLGAHCGTDREQKIVMEAVTKVTQAITDLTGPSCCKAYARAAIAMAVELFSEKFGIVLPVKNARVVCTHAAKHPHGCREERCPYFAKPSRDIFAEAKFVPGTIGCVT